MEIGNYNSRNLLEENKETLEIIKESYDKDETLKSYAQRADEIETTKALDILCDIYMDNCGISLGTRTVAENAIFYWIHRWQQENPSLPQSMGLYDVMELRSEKYKEDKEFYDKYDVTILSGEDLYRICMDMVDENPDDTTRIVLCAGVLNVLDLTDDF